MKSMKLVILGVALLLTGWIGFSLLCSAAISTSYMGDSLYFMDILDLYGLTSVIWALLAMGVIGLVLAILGVLNTTKSIHNSQKN